MIYGNLLYSVGGILMHAIAILFFLSASAYATSYVTTAPKGPVDVLNDMSNFVTSTLLDMTFVAGLAMVAAGIYHYMRYRENPMEVSISKPITFVVLGCILMVLQYIPMSEI